MNLSPQQRHVVDLTDTHIRCLAAPGSGKTRVLIERAVRILRSHHPKEVVLLTFTRKAANEMRERLKAAMPDKRERFWRDLQITTFHSWALRTLRRWSDKIGMVKNFTVRDAADKDDVVLYAGRQLNVVPALGAKKKAGQVSTAKSAWEREAVRHTYWSLMRESQAADYDMLEMLLHGLFKKPAVVESIRAGICHVLVDEYQDTSKLQQAILDLLDPPNAFVVGDPGQGIYGFRGAHPEGFHELGARPGWTTVHLDTNYRSYPPIVAAASRLAAAMEPKGLEQVAGRDWPGEDERAVLDVLAAPTRDALTRLMVEDILTAASLVIGEAMEPIAKDDTGWIRMLPEPIPGIAWRDMAILSPNWDLLTDLEPALTAAGIPCRLARKKGDLWDEPEVRWLVNILRVAVNPEDHLSLWSALNAFTPRVTLMEWATLRSTAATRGISIVDVMPGWVPAKCEYVWQAILRFSVDGLDLDDGLAILQDELRTELHLDSRVEGLMRVAEAIETWAAEWNQTHDAPATTVDFLDWYSERNVHDVADEEDAPDAVTLGSVHSFKGLERKAVWIVGCEEGRWPRSEQGAAYQESLRLFYVAATRGKDRVRLCTSLHKPPSRFIFLACPDWSVPNV